MVRVRAGESFLAAVQRERGLFKAAAAPMEGTTAGARASASAGVPEGSKGSGEEGRPQRRRRRVCRLDETVFQQESKGSGSNGTPSQVRRTEGAGVPRNSKGSGSCGPPEMPPLRMRAEGAGVAKKRKVSGSLGPATPPPPPGVRTEGAGVTKKTEVSGSRGPAMPPPPGVQTGGAVVSQNGNGSASCGPAMPPPGMQTEGAGVSHNSKGSGSHGPEIPPPQTRTEGASVSQKSKGSGSDAPATAPSRVRLEGAGVLELDVEDTDALDCGVCFLPLKPPIFQCNNGHVVCSLCHDKLKATGKCHVCGITTDGNSRCHAIERLAESIRFLCPNAAYGCTARPVYHDREGHLQKCPHSPCCCPDKACCFIGPMESLLNHFACVHGWLSFTTALGSGHFSVSLHDGFNFLRVDNAASSSPGILFLLNVVRSPLGRAISMLCIDTRAANNGQGQFSKEPIECELTYSRHESSESRSTSDQLTEHYQRCKFKVALTDHSNGLPSTVDCFQFVVSNFALGEENKETFQVEGRIFISSINLC